MRFEKNIFYGGSHHKLLSRSSFNGLFTQPGGGFVLNTDKQIKSIEFFMTLTTKDPTTLINALNTNFSWTSQVVNKQNISKVYINGIDKTSHTSINTLLPYVNDLYHVIIVFNSPISEEILFNSGTLDPAILYKNLAIYEYELDSNKVQEHYNLYTSIPAASFGSNTITVTESAIKAFDVNWQVIQSR